MLLVMAYIAKSDKVVRCIRSTTNMVYEVMEFQKTPRIPFPNVGLRPIAVRTTIRVRFQNLHPHDILYLSIMIWCLSINLQNVNANRKRWIMR